MNDMLQATVEMGTGVKAAIAGWPAGGKTGTSQNFRDAWFIGYTANLTAGVWVGNDSDAPTKHASGGSVPAEIWGKFMTKAHSGVPVAQLPGTEIVPYLLAQTPPTPENGGWAKDGWFVVSWFSMSPTWVKPRSTRCNAADSPEIPPPTMHTSARVSPESGA